MEDNEDEKKKKERVKKIVFRILRHPIILLTIVIVLIVIIMSAAFYALTKKNAKENPNDPKNGPAAARSFMNDTNISENGKIELGRSVKELWDELKQNGNAITKYLNSPEELAKLMTASMALKYPDTRPNPDAPINWEDIDIESKDVQGIVKFKRALSSGKTITMTYLSPSEFQKKMNKYNQSGKESDRNEALKYFTVEKSYASSSSGVVDVGSRDYNDDVFHLENHIDIYKKSDNLYGGVYDAVQGCCFDGKYIICSANKGKEGKSGGRIFWIDMDTKKLESSYVDVGAEGGHMEGITYDSDRKMVLCIVKNKRLLQIDNQTRSTVGYTSVKQSFRHLAYSVTTHELIGFNSGKNTVTFMKYDSSKNKYVEQRTVKLNDAHFTNIQGISSDGQVIYLSDSRPQSEMNPSDYRVWVYDFQGNKVEEHAIGNEYHRGTKEVENCFADKEGNLWLMLPHELGKVKDYKAHPVDWENNYSPTANETNNTFEQGEFSKTEEILEYACSWIGKISYQKGAGGKLVNGGKSDCSHFVHRVYEQFGLMNKFVSSRYWGRGGNNGGCPGTIKLGRNINVASPGDVIWEHYSENSNHVYIYLGKDKDGKHKKVQCASTNHKKGVYISTVSQSQIDEILHFTKLPRDPNAYFDPETGTLHTSKSKESSNSSNSSSSSSSASSSSSSSSTSSTSSTSSNTSNKSLIKSGKSHLNSNVSGQDIINEAEKYVGKLPYVWGGKSLQTGADCSGFVWKILQKFGYKEGYCIAEQFVNKGEKVADLSVANAGDVLCYKGHVGFYDGHGGIIHEADFNTGCVHGKNANFDTIIAIRRFTGEAIQRSKTALGPVITDEPFGNFSEKTREIILAHRNDFNVNTFKSFFQQHDYNEYVKSLGGVFEEFGGKDKVLNVTDAGTFQRVAEYTWGLFAIYGFNYYNGDFRVRWGADNSVVKQSAFYTGSDHGGYSTGHIDDICSDLNRVNKMRTNCNYGSNAFLQKCGITDDKEFTTHWRRGQLVEKAEDLLIGDLVHFFSSDGKWHHVAVVGEIDPELGPILYDSGNRFIRSGNYKFPVNSNKYSKYAYWIGRRYFDLDQSTAGMAGEESDGNANVVYKVKVATWQESTEKVSSTEDSENKDEFNYSMNPVTVPYQDMVSKYGMPFNYLWSMLLVGQDKNYTFDLADLVKNSQIEITIHDNLQETTTKVEESHVLKYHYEGYADIKMDYTEEGTPSAPDQPPPQTQGSITKKGEATKDTSYPYKKISINIEKINTLDIALTLADSWYVKYEKNYKFDGVKTTNGSPSTEKFDDLVEDGDESDSITNSVLLDAIKDNAKSKAHAELSASASINSADVVPGTAKQTLDCKTVARKRTTKIDTKKSSYTGKPEKYIEDTPEKERFVEVFNKNYGARKNIFNAEKLFFEVLESNQDTVNMVDLTKYLMYKATGKDFGVTTFDFSEFNPADFNDIGGGFLEGNTTEERVWLALINAGFNDVAAAGAMGNLSYESGGTGTKTINTDVVEGGYSENNGGIGMCQWTNNNRGTVGRNTQLQKYAQSKAKTWRDEETQIEFLITEITGSGKAKGYANYQFMTKTYAGVTYSSDSLKNVENDQSKIDFATKAFAATFERPAESAFITSMPKRIELAQYFYSKFNGKKSTSSGGTFNLEHAINVFDGIHAKENGHLKWQGETVDDRGGTLGCYEEAVNIFNGTNYRIYEIYNILVNAHPELRTRGIEPYKLEDMNHRFNMEVTRAKANVKNVKNALQQGKLVQLMVNTNKWRNSKGKWVSWGGTHSGLIFHFDGTYFHMKAAGKINQKNAIYTEQQLNEWIGHVGNRLVIYTKMNK